MQGVVEGNKVLPGAFIGLKKIDKDRIFMLSVGDGVGHDYNCKSEEASTQ